jgi:hypothetical protein
MITPPLGAGNLTGIGQTAIPAKCSGGEVRQSVQAIASAHTPHRAGIFRRTVPERSPGAFLRRCKTVSYL